MRSQIPVKLVCSLLIAVMLSIVLGDVCEGARAGDCGPAFTQDAGVAPEGTGGQCPCCPLDSDAGHQGAEANCTCSCHASLTSQPFSLRYAPFVSDLETFESFAFLPEVFLSKFVPPQSRA